MRIDFLFSEDFEVKRIQNTLRAMPWFREHGYRPYLPEGISEDASEDVIRLCVHETFDPEPYREREKMLLDELVTYQENWNAAIAQTFSAAPEAVHVFLTRYGVDGSYNPPSTVVYSLRDSDGIMTVFHEIVHLCIQEDIDRFGIEHWAKERIVDAILHTTPFAFLHHAPWQRNYRGAEAVVDPLFEQHFFSNRERFYSELALVLSRPTL